MPQVKFTSHLQRFFPGIKEITIEGATVAEIVSGLEEHYPGMSAYIVDEHGELRQHVNIFVGEDMIQDRKHLQDRVKEDERVYIFQALSGG